MATSFVNVSDTTGIFAGGNLTFGSAWGDFNGDNFPDLWVNNHFGSFGNLYLNQGNGSFSDVTRQVFILDELRKDTHGSQWADFDNDGDQDLLQVVSGTGKIEPNRLFINDGGLLRDAAPELGLSYTEAGASSPIWVDIDNNGLLDVVYTTALRPGNPPPTIFRQTSNGFEDVGATVAPEFRSNGSLFGNLADVSGDGNLDLLVDGTRFIFDTTSNPFTNLTNSLGGGAGGTHAITADFNGDLVSDIYLTRRQRIAQLGQLNTNNIRGFFQTNNSEEGVEFTTSGDVTFASSFVSADNIFIGASGINPANPSGTFNEFTLSSSDSNVQGIAERVEPGVYIGYDSGSQTWQVLNFSTGGGQLGIDINSTTAITGVNAINFNPDPIPPNDRLFLNTDQGLVDRTNQAGLSDIRSQSNAVTAGDFDNDMDVDLYIVATGSALNSENVFLDNQGDGTFTKVANAGGAAGSSLGLGDSVTTADYDLDGFLDLFVTNGFVEGTPLFSPSDGEPHQLFRNQGNSNNWLEIDLEGVESNQDGIGAQVFLTAGGVTQLREQSGGVHKWSQDYQRIHFGLAENTQVDLLEIRWPSGTVQQLENIPANQLVQIVEETSTPIDTPPEAVDDSATTQQNQAINIDVLNNDVDADGDPLSLSIQIVPSNGTAVVNDNGTADNFSDDVITYTPNNNFTGNDQFTYEVNDGNGGTDLATVTVTVNSTTDAINGTEGRDTLIGTGENDLINGLGNRDILRGNGGKDTLNGNEGNDNLLGGFNNDVLNGDSGNDLLIGGFGQDILTGGAGSDLFRFFRTNGGTDDITDFSTSEDTIQIKANNFGGGLVSGTLPDSQFVLGTTAADSSDRFIYDQNTGNLLFDVDGNGSESAKAIANLSDRASLSASDIAIF